MSWTDVNYEEVNPGNELLPKGEYVFMLQSASRGKFDPEELNVRLNVATPGPYQGQTVYMRYPNPEKAGKGVPASDPRNWVIKMFKIFEVATGYTINPAEHPVDFVTRICNTADDEGQPIYMEGRVDHDVFPDKETGETITKHKVVPRSLKPYTLVAAAA